jgi:hypothetical protein
MFTRLSPTFCGRRRLSCDWLGGALAAKGDGSIIDFAMGGGGPANMTFGFLDVSLNSELSASNHAGRAVGF